MSYTHMAARASPTAGEAAVDERNGQVTARWMVYFSPLVGLIILAVTLIPRLVLWFRNLGKQGDGVIRSQEAQMETFRQDPDDMKATLGNIQTQAEAHGQSDDTLKVILDEIKIRLDGFDTKFGSFKAV